jgi:PKD repeat protein
MGWNKLTDPLRNLKKWSNCRDLVGGGYPLAFSRRPTEEKCSRVVNFQLAVLIVFFLFMFSTGSVLIQKASAQTYSLDQSLQTPVDVGPDANNIKLTILSCNNPTASFTANRTSGCSPLAVTFTDTSSGRGNPITKWDWDFNGDGVTDHTDYTTPTPYIYTYTTPRTYTAKLTVTTTCGINTKTTTIATYGATADFTATQTSGCGQLSVTFTDASTSSGKTITGWNWDFGDSSTYNGKTPPAHLYSIPGTYTVKLTVTTTCGTNTKTKSNYITVYGTPKANFTATATNGCAQLTVTFTDTSNGNGQAITGWTWDFGDTTTYSGQTPPPHLYSIPGTYTVKLTVASVCGTNTKITYVVVSSLPVIVPGTYGPTCVTKGNITLGGTPAGGNWSGDGISGNIFNPAAAGLGDHVLIYKYTNNSNMCSVSNTTTITVLPLPQTTITVG